MYVAWEIRDLCIIERLANVNVKINLYQFTHPIVAINSISNSINIRWDITTNLRID